MTNRSITIGYMQPNEMHLICSADNTRTSKTRCENKHKNKLDRNRVPR
jgi:hypothetical protein